MTAQIPAIASLVLFVLIFAAWRRYLWVARKSQQEKQDTCPYSLTEVFGDQHLAKIPHQKGVRWLTEIFSRSAKRFPDHVALQIPHTGESLTFSELDARAESVAAAVSRYLTGPDQVVAVAMAQDNWQIVAAHLGILKAGGAVMFLDTTLPDALITHMLEDAQPVVVLTRGDDSFRDQPTLDVLTLPEAASRCEPPSWLDDPTQRLATIFYTSGTTGMPKGVECPHAGYVNLALSYADYFDLVPGMDATTLTSSLGYDGSMSELYSAWVSGCAVVMLTKEQIRSGPDLVPVLREAEVTVLFCPPVLLTTLTPSPEIDLPYPVCRYVVPAGEAFPAALVEPWTRARRQIINTYGPTEASTDTSRQSLRPGEPVTIGSPFANVTYVILEVGGLRPLPHGETGELCIGGVHVARGYRNLPDETAAKFIDHPGFGRLYRTGDRCRIDGRTQRVDFLGRIDTQLKVRGHRVETQPVEDMLQTQFSEIDAAVLDYQGEELIAFVAAPSLVEPPRTGVQPAPSAWADRVTSTLADQLPAPSIPSRVFLVDSFVMKPVSGKIDRKRLPDLSRLPSSAGSTPEDAGEELSTLPGSIDLSGEVTPHSDKVLEICRDVFERPLGWDDAFADHGGHSIVIARLAQRLQTEGWAVPVRALLSDCDTPRKVALRQRDAKQAPEDPAATTPFAEPRTRERDETAARVLSVGLFTSLQALFLLLLYAPSTLAFLALIAFAEIGEFFMTASLWEFIAVGFVMHLAALVLPFTSLLWAMLIKLFMGGHPSRNRVTPGIYPKWSRMHLRIWCIRRLERSVLQPLGTLVRSAPLMAYMLRRLGAEIGANLQCAHDVEFSGPLDLLSIGDDVAIQSGAGISVVKWVGDELHLGPVHLGSGCKIGVRAAVANSVTVGRDSWITPLSPVLRDVGENELWDGAPARFVGRCTTLRRPREHCRAAFPVWLTESLNMLMQVILDFVLLVAPTTAVTWLATALIPARTTGLAGDYFRITPLPEIIWHLGLYTFTTTWVTIVLISFLGCLFLRVTAASAGLRSSQGLSGAILLYRIMRFNQLQRLWTWTITGQYLRALAGLRFTRVGGSECDLMYNLVPEMAAADAQVFWSHGGFSNMLDYGAEHMVLRPVEMPKNFFAGNNCVVEFGKLPTNFLLGVSTPANEIRFRRQMRSRPAEPTTVAGNPPVRFASADFETENEAQTLPGFGLFFGRILLNDIFSIGLLPTAEVLVFAVFTTILLRLGQQPVISALVALILAEITLVVSSLAVKKILVGKTWGSAHTAPFWSWRHFTYFFAQDCFFAWCKRTLAITAGSVMSNAILRGMGCRIGKRTLFAAPLQAYDWNAVSFGDDCVVAGQLQYHSMENMTLRVKRTTVQDGSAINSGSTVMGGAVIAPGTTLMPLSLVLKEMHLPTATYEGSPTEVAVDDRTCQHPDLGGSDPEACISSSHDL
jgi:non-ribosomal peptide synthetase-like protein